MTVITENTIRRIVRSKARKRILKEAGSGLYRQSIRNYNRSSPEYLECDLSGLKNTEAARKFIKYILLKPEFKQIKDGEEKTFSKNMLRVFIEGGLDDKKSSAYDKHVEDYINRNKTQIDTLVDMLEYSITSIFGPMSSLYCKIFSTIFLSNTDTNPKNKSQDTNSDLDTKIKDAFKNAGKMFNNEYGIFSVVKDFEYESIVIMPNTFISIKNNDMAAAASFKQQEKFVIEDLIQQRKLSLKDFNNTIDRNLFYGISKKKEILKYFKNLDLVDSEEVQISIQKYLYELLSETLDDIQKKYSI